MTAKHARQRRLGWLAIGLLAVGAIGTSACDRDPVAPPTESPETEQAQEASQDGEAAGPSASGELEVADEETAEPEPPEEVVVPDFQLFTRIRLRLATDELTREENIRVAVLDTNVTLSGTASTHLAPIRAEAIARETWGIGEVTIEVAVDDEAEEASEEERTEAATVPDTTLAAAPQFADGVRNYGTGEIVEPFVVVVPPREQQAALEAAEREAAELEAAEALIESGGTAAEAVVPEVVEEDHQTSRSAPASYTVQSGDSLWDIAQETMGDGSRWEELYEANRDVIGNNSENVRAGQTLVIPD